MADGSSRQVAAAMKEVPEGCRATGYLVRERRRRCRCSPARRQGDPDAVEFQQRVHPPAQPLPGAADRPPGHRYSSSAGQTFSAPSSSNHDLGGVRTPRLVVVAAARRAPVIRRSRAAHPADLVAALGMASHDDRKAKPTSKSDPAQPGARLGPAALPSMLERPMIGREASAIEGIRGIVEAGDDEIHADRWAEAYSDGLRGFSPSPRRVLPSPRSAGSWSRIGPWGPSAGASTPGSPPRWRGPSSGTMAPPGTTASPCPSCIQTRSERLWLRRRRQLGGFLGLRRRDRADGQAQDHYVGDVIFSDYLRREGLFTCPCSGRGW